MKVAKSYSGYKFDETKAYEKNGKLYVKAACKCDRCGGLGIIASRVENGRIIPIPVDAGICYKCEGKKYVTKEIRLYTDEEYAKMEIANEKAAEKRAEAREAKIKAEYAQNKLDWLTKNGFTDDGLTYIYAKNDSFDVKDTLKAVGFKFDTVLKWHIAEIPAGYEDKVIEVKTSDIIEFTAWGKGVFVNGAYKIIEQRIAAFDPKFSAWYGEVGQKFTDLPATLTSIHQVETRFGLSNLVKFTLEGGEELNWWTTVTITAEVGSKVLISGTIKDHSEYKGDKVTLVTRCKIKEIA